MMTTITKKYRLWILAVACVTLYLLTGEIASRLTELIDRYGDLQKKEAMIMTPEEFLRKKHSLEHQKRELARMVESTVATRSAARESSIGVFDYVSAQAQVSGIRLHSFAPKEEHPSGSGVDAAFSLLCSGRFHDVARFVNLVETGDVPVVITQLTIQQQPVQAENIHALGLALEGRAHLSKKIQ